MAADRPPRRLLVRLSAAAGALVALGLAALAALWLLLPDPAEWRARNPPTTALIEQRKAEAALARRRYRPQQAWVPLERISRRLVTAVVASEDATFFGHRGFDWAALQAAARHDLARGRFARGASTITQQLAKNLYLGTEKSLLRKAKEAVLAAKLERALDKRRILALYLNVAEWGDGTFGVEAGARRHLGVGAGSLSTAQAVLLASMLPAPRRVDLSRPSAWLRGRATRLLDRLRDEKVIPPDEHRAARVELARLLAGPAPADDREEPPEEEGEEEVATPTSASTPSSAAAHPEPFDSAAQERGYAQDRLRAGGAESRGTPTPTPTPEPTPAGDAPPEAQGDGAGTAGQAPSEPPEQPARPQE